MKQTLKPLILCLALLAPASVFAQQATPAPEATTEQPAAVDMAQEQAAATEESASSAPANGAIGAPPEGRGQIVFFRDKKFTGAAIRYKVREGATELGKLSNGSYFVHVAEPGAHEYTVHSEAKDILNLEVEAGETYYVIGGITMGFLAGRPNLSPSDQAAFDGMKAKLKPAAPLKP